MAVDIEQAGAVIGLVNQMIVPDFVVQRGRLDMSVSSKKFAGERGYARIQGNVSAASKRACKFRCRRGREPSEKAPGRRLRSSITIGAASWQPVLIYLEPF